MQHLTRFYLCERTENGRHNFSKDNPLCRTRICGIPHPGGNDLIFEGKEYYVQWTHIVLRKSDSMPELEVFVYAR